MIERGIDELIRSTAFICNPKSIICISTLPIGIFDSGVGGLTVYRALHERLPNEHFVYLGDTARVPYGTKSLSTVERYAIENAKFLEAHGIKLLVVACNTASALALPAIRKAVKVTVVGVIEPGARAAVAVAAGKKIGVIATEATVQSGAYARAIAKSRASIQPAKLSSAPARCLCRSPKKVGRRLTWRAPWPSNT